MNLVHSYGHLINHLSAHSMDEDGENWIAHGLDYSDQGTCPFCGQNIQGLPLITAYRAVFSDSYKALRVDIEALLTDIANQFGDGALGLDMQSYLSTGAGEPIDLIRKMRAVLESYCWTTYPACFNDNDWLGDIIRKIREGGDQHPAKDLYDELDQINSYNKMYHHGEKTDTIPDQIDPRGANRVSGPGAGVAP